MKTDLIPLVAFALLALTPAARAAGAQPEASASIAADRARALDAIQLFQKALKSELMKAMGQGGPEAAVTVCNEKAPGIAKAMEQEKGLHIGRTSLKVRNPANAPDTWEKAVLEKFEHDKAAGNPVAALEATLVDGKSFRFMKAIPMQGLCTTCHGTSVNPKLYKTIKALYPQDQAVGFSAGDIRGAFAVTIPLDDKAAQD